MIPPFWPLFWIACLVLLIISHTPCSYPRHHRHHRELQTLSSDFNESYEQLSPANLGLGAESTERPLRGA